LAIDGQSSLKLVVKSTVIERQGRPWNVLRHEWHTALMKKRDEGDSAAGGEIVRPSPLKLARDDCGSELVGSRMGWEC